MNWNIITPYFRTWNLSPLTKTMGEASNGSVHWCLASDDGRPTYMHVFGVGTRNLPCPACPTFFDPAYWKANYVLDATDFEDSEYYGFLCDDDTYDPGFFARLDAELNGQLPAVVIVNARRIGEPSQRILHARPDHMRVGLVGFEQFFIRGDIMRHHRFENSSVADGRLIQCLHSKMPDDFFYSKECFVNWNSLPQKPT